MDEPLEERKLVTTEIGDEGQITVPAELSEHLKLEPGMPIAVVRVGHGLMVFTEQTRFGELCERLQALLADSGSSDVELLRGVAAIIANQERMLANHDAILANEERIATK